MATIYNFEQPPVGVDLRKHWVIATMEKVNSEKHPAENLGQAQKEFGRVTQEGNTALLLKG